MVTGEAAPKGPALRLWAAAMAFSAAFTTLIWLLGSNLRPFTDNLLPDQGAAWYYWKLASRDFWGMLIVWIMYLVHQVGIWTAIYCARRDIKGLLSKLWLGLPRYSWLALGITLVFVCLHLAQTHIWFDGLAQDVPIMSSQASVVIMLAVVLILENPRRGLILGKKAGRPFTAGVVAFFRRSHTYIFAWALVYTFWFHPMATDPQLLSGFYYMFLLFTQLILAWTWVHFEQKWIVLLESYVAIHAVIVAIFNRDAFQSADMWPMFFTGFSFMFVFTYLYAFKLPRPVYWLAAVIYVLFIVWLFIPAPLGYGRDLSNLMRLEFIWIPFILYALAFVFAGLAYLKYK